MTKLFLPTAVITALTMISVAADDRSPVAAFAEVYARRGCPSCSVPAIRSAIAGQMAHDKGDGSAWDYACGAMLHVRGSTETFLTQCFGPRPDCRRTAEWHGPLYFHTRSQDLNCRYRGTRP